MTPIDICRVTGPLRKQAELLLEQHYMGSSGGSGYMIAAIEGDVVVAATLIGPASSMAAERSIVGAPWRVWAIKRLFATEACPVPETKLLRSACRMVANLRHETMLFCAYADPLALDMRYTPPRPLAGGLYLAASFMYVGETSQPRYAVIDEHGRARSSRQGARTLTRNTLPTGWQMQRIPPARVWLAVVPPAVMMIDGEERPTSQRWRKTQWRAVWTALNPKRRVAAQQWVSERHWQQLQRRGRVALGAPRRQTAHQRLQPAYWAGSELQRTAGPVWVPFVWQGSLLDQVDVEHEQTAGRSYLPRMLAGLQA